MGKPLGQSRQLGWLFGTTLALSALLMFWGQLMIAKECLPVLGGAPAVWNTCMGFFQGTLLLGYTYAHGTAGRGDNRQQGLRHLGFLLLTLPFLPLTLTRWGPLLPTGSPVLWLLGTLLVTVALPLIALSATAPLLQRWFAALTPQDPYLLYAASNAGSLVGLLSYPTLIEPSFSLTQQRLLWTAGYGVLVGLIGLCGWRLRQQGGEYRVESSPLTSGRPGWRTQLQWGMLAFLPSSLLLGVTTYLTTDLAAMPLLWAIPLALYLMTFILAFGQPDGLPLGGLATLLPPIVVPLILAFLLHVVTPLTLLVPLHLLGFTGLALVCHGELARRRPAAQHLTLFYLWVALGGMVGGLFTALVAPTVFPMVQEYPLALSLGLLILFMPVFRTARLGPLSRRFSLWLGLGVLLGGLQVGLDPAGFAVSGWLVGLAVLGLWIYSLELSPLVAGLGVLLVTGLFLFRPGTGEGPLTLERSFFGVYRVFKEGEYQSLLHGTTLHGKQSLRRPQEPLTYYGREGPAGQVFAAFRPDQPRRIGIIGLGVGTLAAYGRPGDQMTFYEIDPLAEQLAREPYYFTFLAETAADLQVVTGDGRLSLSQVPAGRYDLLVMDAFTSDAIPIHLLTREAVALYFTKLTDQGVLLIHITNRFLDLEPVVGRIAADLNLVARHYSDWDVSAERREQGMNLSDWVILARRPADLAFLGDDPRWEPLNVPPGRSWTDQYSNLLGAIRWQERP